jgi:nucleoside-diphosphate-sugar epimerase
MHVAVTGGTGYLGAHTVRALLESGHSVRLLVMSGEEDGAVADGLRRLGTVEVVVGDIRDGAVVDRLLDGSDALIHAAGIVGTDRRRAKLMWAVNAYGTERILNRAAACGLDPVVLVSSYSALFPPPAGQPIGPDTPTARGRSPYARTKAYADRIARRLQERGEPIVVTYPSSVVGEPFLTAPGVTERGWHPIIRAGIAPRMRGGMQMIDVRDVAEVHLRLMRPGQGPHRYVCGGMLLTFDEMIDALEVGLGRRIRRVPLSTSLFLGLGWCGDLVGGFVQLGDGLSYEAAQLLTAAVRTDDSQTLTDLKMTWRSPRQAIIDSVRSGQARRGNGP